MTPIQERVYDVWFFLNDCLFFTGHKTRDVNFLFSEPQKQKTNNKDGQILPVVLPRRYKAQCAANEGA